jgi:hyaluronoglucosaminidase
LAALFAALIPSSAQAAPHRTEWRGVVEGFYGTPWTHADRLSTLKWMGRHGMNLYIYAPKDDPYHRDKWREPYPAEDLRRFSELAKEGEKDGVLVMVAISPGPTMTYSDPKDVKALLDKMDALNAAGIHRFAVFLDDIAPELQHAEDKAAYPELGAAHVDLLNKVIAHLRKKGMDKPFVTVGQEYWNLNETPYKKAMRDDLDPGVLMMWTGEGVVTRSLTPAMVSRFTNVYGRPPFLWDNFPVNDYATTRLFMGPLMYRSDVGHLVSGFTMNPMNQAMASRLGLYTAAAYLNNTADYKPWTQWEAARRETFGKTPATREPLGALAELNAQSPLFPGNGPLLTALISRYDKSGHRSDNNRWKLEDFFNVCAKIDTRLDQWLAKGGAAKEPDVARLIEEVRPWLQSVKAAGEAGLLARALDEKPDAETYRRMNAAWGAANKGPHIAGVTITSFIRDAAVRYRARSGDRLPEVTTNLPTWEANWPDNIVDGNDGTYFWSGRSVTAGDAITVDLRKPQTATRITVLGNWQDRPDDFIREGVVEVSDNGVNWTEAGKLTQAETTVEFAPRPVRYIRLRVTAGQDRWIAVREIKVE